MRRVIQRLRCRRGTATIEFALMSLFFFGAVMVALDLGMFVQQKLKLGQAVEAGAIMAFNRQTGSDTSAVSTYVAAAAGTKVTPTVTIKCNGSSSASDCAVGRCSCLTASGGFTAVGNCGSPKAVCATGGVEGNYMQIKAELVYTPMVVPDRYLSGKTMNQTAVVRLQ